QAITIRGTRMMTAATIQPSAIHRPPHTIHATLSRRERTDILRHLTHAPRANVDAEIGACQPRMKWLRHWFDAGSRAIEDVLARDPRSERDRLTIADICLVAHLTSAKLLCDPPATAGGRTGDGATLREYKIRPSALP